MNIEKLMGQILSKHPEISKEEILERLNREKDRTAGFIEDKVLLQVIAAELGMETSKDTLPPMLSTEHLIPGLNDVTVVGRVVAVFRPKSFTGRRSGKVGSLLMVDQKGVLRVVLWNEKADFIEEGKIKVGELIRFSHGYTKKGYSGKVELHLGDRSEIELTPDKIDTEEYPTIDKFVTKIGDITRAQKNRRVHIKGVVEDIFPASNFERDNSSPGKVMRLRLGDESGNTTVVAWNERVDQLQGEVKKGDGLRVVNGKVREASNGGVEIHVNKGTYFETFRPTFKISKIADLKEKQNHVNVEGEVVGTPVSRKVNTRKGNQVRLTSFELKDKTGRIWVSAWRKHAQIASELKRGQKVNIKNAYVKEGYTSRLELSTRNTTQIKPFPEKPSEGGEKET